MPLSWNEIRDRATHFQKRWKAAEKENAESQSFWTEFLHIFDIDRERVGLFEKQVEIKRARKSKACVHSEEAKISVANSYLNNL